MGEIRNVHKILFGNPEEKRPFGRSRRIWEENIKMDLREIGWLECGLDSSSSGYGQVAGSCEHGNGPSSSIKG
jgi:hypothetical protein